MSSGILEMLVRLHEDTADQIEELESGRFKVVAATLDCEGHRTCTPEQIALLRSHLHELEAAIDLLEQTLTGQGGGAPQAPLNP